ncbi:MAG: class I SAM-dependent methyltransferase [Pseudonocardia sp.]
MDNPLRGRFNAAVLRLADGSAHRLLGARKAGLLAGHPDRLVELGPGTGVNFRYYRPGTTVVAVEPNPHMHDALRAAAARRGVTLDLRAVGGEATGLPDACVDTVVATLVLCTVPDPAAVLAEARRILAPGGRLVVVEHVAAPAGTALRRFQTALRPGWRWLFEGCDLCRDTAALIRAAGFADVDVQRYRLRSPLLPINEQVSGTATA